MKISTFGRNYSGVFYLRRQPHHQTVVIRQRQQRDLIVIRRISIIVRASMVFGTPILVFILMMYITGKVHPSFRPVGWLSIATSLMELTFVVVILTLQLKSIIRKNLSI